MTGFTEANAAYLDVAMELGERAIRKALDAAGLQPSDVDIVFSTTVTGLVVPTLEARLAGRIGLRPDVKRVPLFGLGCVAGAAGVARMHDYLRAYPDQVAVLLAVELCSLTVQRDDLSMPTWWPPACLGTVPPPSLRWAPARAHRAAGRARAGHPQPALPGHRRRDGLGYRQRGIPDRAVRRGARPSPRSTWATTSALFLADYGLATADISTWVCHPGGPKVIEAVENVLDLPDGRAGPHPEIVARQREPVVGVGADVLLRHLADPPPPGVDRADDRHGPGVLLRTRAARLVAACTTC